MKCLWCGFQTTTDTTSATETVRYANKEHIFPEAVEGKKTLEQGKVCQLCNARLGRDVDANLKQGNLAMIRQYQESSAIKGRPVGKYRDKEDKARKEAETKYLEDRSERKKSIGREGDLVEFTNYPHVGGRPIDLDFDEKFSKALLKCAVNVLYDQQSQETMQNTYPDALDFVNKPNYEGSRSWPYAACYSHFSRRASFEPTCIARTELNNTPVAVALLFPCALFFVGMYSNILDWRLVQNLKRSLEESGDSEMLEHFGSATSELNFYYLNKHIRGIPDPSGMFHLLTECRVCQQANPTGFGINRGSVLKPTDGSFRHASHSWNSYTKDDLVTMGVNLDGMSVEKIDSFIRGIGINMPENFSSLTNIIDCVRACINCGEQITFSSKDCFL